MQLGAHREVIEDHERVGAARQGSTLNIEIGSAFCRTPAAAPPARQLATTLAYPVGTDPKRESAAESSARKMRLFGGWEPPATF
jgi:hypothetical protein